MSKELAKKTTAVEWLMNPKTKSQLAMALPRHITPDRMARIALTALRTSPDLNQCDIGSLMASVITTSQMGLEPNTPLGHCYLVPYNNRKKGIKEAQLIIGYKGMIELARRSGQIRSISARVVREGDEFSYQYGIVEDLKHRATGDEEAPITHVYAVAQLVNGGYQFEVMTKGQINKVRSKSPGKDSTFWTVYWEEMAKKTAVRRLFKYLPISIELQTAAAMDERAEAGESQEDFIDAEVAESMERIAPPSEEQKEETAAEKMARELEEREQAQTGGQA